MEARGFWEGIPIQPFLEGPNVNSPMISPSGKYIAYQQRIEKSNAIYLYDIDSGVHQQLTYGRSPSTGTAYGGKTYTWYIDNDHQESIIFSEKGKLYKIQANGGIMKEIYAFEKAFSPFVLDDKMLFVVEEIDKMSLGSVKLSDSDNPWPIRLPITYNFIYDPVMSQDGKILVHAWDYPNMSWDGSEILLLTPTEDGWDVKSIGGSASIATSQPKFSPTGEFITYLSEETGWLNLWIANADGSNAECLVKEELEHAYSTWVTGDSNYVWMDNENILFTRNNKGVFSLAIVNSKTKTISPVDLPDGAYSKLSTDGNGRVVLEYSNHNTKFEIWLISVSNNRVASKTVIVTSGVKLDSLNDSMIKPEIITFPTRDGESASGLYYCEGERSSNPPIVINVHGGPTGMSTDRFYLSAQYFAKKGWAVFNINHRGSIGHGSKFRQKLTGNWGVYDTDDCIDALEYLDKEGYGDKDRAAIMGGSAGGYTTLMSLVKYPGVYKAGVNLFGVSDLFLLDEETHYLEAKYTTMLVGALPQAAKKYRDMSPVFNADKIVDPLLILQGEDDPVVPKNQSELIEKGVKGIVESKYYPGEGHGFQKHESLIDMYSRVDRFLRTHVLYSFE